MSIRYCNACGARAPHGRRIIHTDVCDSDEALASRNDIIKAAHELLGAIDQCSPVQLMEALDHLRDYGASMDRNARRRVWARGIAELLKKVR